MATVSLTIERAPDVVYGALIDPDTYPAWLVGCQGMRSIDEGWPMVGTRFHHRVGLGGPLVVDDSSQVLDLVTDELLRLEVRARPLGRGEVTFRLTAVARPDGVAATTVEMHEVPIGALAPARPLLDPFTAARNRRSLQQLRDYLV